MKQCEHNFESVEDSVFHVICLCCHRRLLIENLIDALLFYADTKKFDRNGGERARKALGVEE